MQVRTLLVVVIGITAMGLMLAKGVIATTPPQVQGWGCNQFGQTGTGPATLTDCTPSVDSPSAVVCVATVPCDADGHLKNIIALASGMDHSLALTADRKVLTWGNNALGQLGWGYIPPVPGGNDPPLTAYSEIPGNIVSPFLSKKNIMSIAGGREISIVADSEGHVWTWGGTAHGMLGRVQQSGDPAYWNRAPGLVISPSDPTQPLEGIVSVAAAYYYCLALHTDGTVYAWGWNFYGVLGMPADNDTHVTPVQIQGLSDVVAISAGRQFAAALKRDGSIWTWGVPGSGELGRPASDSPWIPAPVLNISNVVAISCGSSNVMALDQTGQAWAWGWGGHCITGQTGNTSTPRMINVPPLPAPPDPVNAISVGFTHALAITASGKVWAWGYNQYGQLGIGIPPPPVDYCAPVLVPTLGTLGALAVAASAQEGFHSLAIFCDGSQSLGTPSAPTFWSNNGGATLVVEWPEVVGANRYDVYRKEARGCGEQGDWVRIGENVPATRFFDTTLTPTVFNSYYIVARNACGLDQTAGPCNQILFYEPPPPPPPPPPPRG